MGRHSAPDDYDDDAPAVLSAPPASTGRPRPGRHSGERHEQPDEPVADQPAELERPRGLDVIETAMDDDADPDADADADEVTEVTEVEGHTDRIAPIVDPVLDEPLPIAVTTVIVPVTDAETPPPRPSPQATPGPDGDGPSDQPDASETATSDTSATSDTDDKAAAKAAKSEAKAANSEAKAAAKADAKAAKAAAKAERAAATKGSKTKPSRPEPRVSDLALLRADSAARARVIAAVVAPFVLYVVVLLVLGSFDLRTVLIWIWLPLITAGVVAGLLLDLAHRAAAARAIAAVEPEREPAEDTAGR